MGEYRIDDPPKLPERIKEAVKHRKLIVFTGAGVSSACGLPSWEQLAYFSLKGKINYAEEVSLKNKKYEPRRLMSLAKEYFPDDISFRENICKQLNEAT